MATSLEKSFLAFVRRYTFCFRFWSYRSSRTGNGQRPAEGITTHVTTRALLTTVRIHGHGVDEEVKQKRKVVRVRNSLKLVIVVVVVAVRSSSGS